MSLHPLIYENDLLKVLDQRVLPLEEIYLKVTDEKGAFTAIKDMAVRGAPCIGFTGLYAIVLWLKNHSTFDLNELEKVCQFVKSARPTAVNLAFEVDRLQKQILNWREQKLPLYESALKFTQKIIQDAEDKNLKMAKFAQADLEKRGLKNNLNILTHCNTGHLACGTLGTAFGAISHLHSQNKIKHVWVDETRPYLQGSRLTAFELGKENIPHQIVVEGAASYLMSNGLVDAIFVGADRIAFNGDTANKVGTSNLAHIAKYYAIPFYVVAPLSSFDFSISSGREIEIELRDENEIHMYKEHRISPHNSKAFNPSFDITPGHLITGIICEDGVYSYPYTETFARYK